MSFVQSGEFHTNTVSASSVVVTLTGVASGNLICGYAVGIGASVTGITDDKGNTYTVIDDLFGVPSFYAKTVTGGTVVITAALDAAATQRAMIVHEVSGRDLSNPLNAHAAANVADHAVGTDAASTGSFTTTADGCYVFCVGLETGGAAYTLSAGTNYTARVDRDNLVGELEHLSEDLSQTTAGSVAGLITVGGALNFNMVIYAAAFAPAGRGLLLRGVG